MTDRPPAGGTRAEDALVLLRLVARTDSVPAILEWLGRRTGGCVSLVAGDGTVLGSSPGPAAPEIPPAVRNVYTRGMPSGVVGGNDGRTVHMVAVGRDSYLVLDGQDSHLHGTLLADTAGVLALCRGFEETERVRRRTELTEAHSREAVLHLLMGGSVSVAHRIAAAMGSQLPSPLRVCVVECPQPARSLIAESLGRLMEGRAWIIPCPVRANHLIALVPAGDSGWEAPAMERLPGCRVGASEEMSLPDTPLGYEQAFHALAVARATPDRWARFSPHSGLAPLLGPEGSAWAARLLGPCLAHRPARRSDPGGEELLGTLGSWLTFGTAADRHLKIHRNTLAARLRLLEKLLGLALSVSLADRSAAWLALRLHTWRPQAPGPPTALDSLLAAPAAQSWARAQLAPLGPAAETVRAWLTADARLPEAAAGLGISPPGARKRLARAEVASGRSLLHAPSACHELWLAMRALGEL
ncbi:helix-turn-helix domain-containing protein [Streptomyces tsukubensis]|uniref:PucR family transcriptional regulator n=1 Tax=Streptomyces tsukubensis TaxID=83656 RepID=A0A1V4AEW0_9ACTN|nr:helix-turn-helix domain-containing protein [Streptomyces tsukubensis]OON82646.1 hypothetical protein B1H18_00850 [Streptomyces tsukubensis]QFR92183.1 PucR family transcriptional regulator [Streptomyces tsukubensis]